MHAVPMQLPPAGGLARSGTDDLHPGARTSSDGQVAERRARSGLGWSAVRSGPCSEAASSCHRSDRRPVVGAEQDPTCLGRLGGNVEDHVPVAVITRDEHPNGSRSRAPAGVAVRPSNEPAERYQRYLPHRAPRRHPTRASRRIVRRGTGRGLRATFRSGALIEQSWRGPFRGSFGSAGRTDVVATVWSCPSQG